MVCMSTTVGMPAASEAAIAPSKTKSLTTTSVGSLRSSAAIRSAQTGAHNIA
jgi:hypothetical protein